MEKIICPYCSTEMVLKSFIANVMIMICPDCGYRVPTENHLAKEEYDNWGFE